MMGMADILISGAIGLGLTALGYVLGKRAKLRELYKLQDEGFLTITYLGHHKNGVKGKDVGPTMHELLHGGQPDDEPELRSVRYPRRDRDSERRTDWARPLKARQQRELDQDEPE